MTTTDPEITLLLSIEEDYDGIFGDPFAALLLSRAAVEQMLRRADLFRINLKMDPELLRSSYPGDNLTIFESGGFGKEPLAPKDAAQVLAILDSGYDDDDDYVVVDDDVKRFPEAGFRKAEPDEVPANTNVVCSYRHMVITPAGEERPGMVDFHWEAAIKNRDGAIETCELKEEDVRALLAELPLH